MTANDREAKNDVLMANEAFYRAFEKRDAAAMGEIWSHGVESCCIHPGRQALVGWDAIGASWEGIFKNTRYIEIEIELLKVEMSGDLAYIVLIETVMQIAGNRRIQARSMATNVFERMAQQWYLVHHHGSPLLS
jgi:ketosteroid isomerase-like protein